MLHSGRAVMTALKFGRKRRRRGGGSFPAVRQSGILPIRALRSAAGFGQAVIRTRTAAAASLRRLGGLLPAEPVGLFFHSQILPGGLTDFALLIPRAQTGPGSAGSDEGPLGEVGDRFGREANRLAGAAGDRAAHSRRGACHTARESPCHAGHISRLHRLPARAVGKDAGQESGGLLGSLKAAEDQHQLGHLIQNGVVGKQHQLGADHNGQVNQQQAHGDDGCENAEGLNHKSGHPLPGLAAVV